MAQLQDTRLFKFWERYEHRLGIGALLLGFSFDLWIAKTPDSFADNILLITYLFVSGCLIIFLNLRSTQRKEHEHSPEPFFFLLILQFCFGGLSSNLLVLYGKSGTLVGSGLFLLMLLALLLGNEFLRSRYAHLRFHIATYYILLVSYLTIAVPTFIFHAISTKVFLATGLISLALMVPFFIALRLSVSQGKQDKKVIRQGQFIIGGLFLGFNLLYFLNIIPPVPLSVKEIGVYHSLIKNYAGDYALTYEPTSWYVFWRDTSSVFTVTSSVDSAYCFSAIYAPGELSTPIYHHWEKYNQDSRRWVTISRVSFPINGGRDQGYRGWSVKENLDPGLWRCNVETQAGGLIGRISFTVVQAPVTPTLSTITL